MPAYNHDRFVGSAIESILDQSMSDLELLICDDRSSDLTFDVIRSYCDDPRLSAERMPHRSGPSITVNAALRRARGKYIAFCASDDRWLPDKLERQVAYLERRPEVQAVFSRPWLIDASGERLPDDRHDLGRDFGGTSFGRADWLARFFFTGNCLCASTPLLRSDAMRRIGEFDPLLLQLQDFDYWLRFMCHFDFVLQPERCVEYRVDNGGANVSTLSHQSMARTLFESHRVLRHFSADALAESMSLVRLDGADALSWQAPAPHRDLMLANLALRSAQAGYSPHHLLFALDCLYRYGSAVPGLEGGAGEARLFSLALFDVTGSQMAQDLFLGRPSAAAAPAKNPIPEVAPPAPAGGFWHSLRRKAGGK